MSREKFYLTTPIFYPNGKPHIGHAYNVIATDALARFQRLDGKDVFFLSGTDEHGLKMQQTADAGGHHAARARRPQLGDLPLDGRGAGRLQRRLHPHHRAAPLRGLPGDLEGDGRQWRHLSRPLQRLVFGAPGSLFRREAKPRVGDDGVRREPLGSPVEWNEEESYFFRLSAYQDRLLALYESQPDFIGPAERRNEVMSFVKSGLKDLSISRTTFNWGVPVPGDDKHVMYVWVDALTNYITAPAIPDAQAPAVAVTGRPTSTSSARTSSASTRSTGRPS